MSGGRRARRIATLLIRFSVELTQRMRISLCAAFTVCKAVIDTIDKSLTDEDRKDLVAIESKMFKWCAGSKGKDKTMVSSHAAARCWAAAATGAQPVGGCLWQRRSPRLLARSGGEPIYGGGYSARGRHAALGLWRAC